MEEIKTFAGAAKQMYDAAVQEAKLKKLAGKGKDDDGSADIEDGKKVLTEAAKAVEGPGRDGRGPDAQGGWVGGEPVGLGRASFEAPRGGASG